MTQSGHGRPNALQAWLTVIAVGLVAMYVGSFVAKNVHLQWDFRIYRAAAQCALQGLDPYLVENLQAVSGRPADLRFLYPPAALLFFLPVAVLPTTIALWLWIGFGAALLAGLVVLVRRLTDVDWLPLVLVAVFGFNGAALWSLRSGNVSLLESTLLWVAFAFYVRERRVAFGLLVASAAVFKLLPLAFLALLLVPTRDQGSRPQWVAAIVAGFAAVVAGPLLVGPASSWQRFTSNVPASIPEGDANPGALALATSLARNVSTDPDVVFRIALAAWCASLVVVAAVSLPWLIRAWWRRDALHWVMGAAMLFTLCSPRPMAYGYLLVVAPALYFTRGLPGTLRLLIALALAAQGLARVASHPPLGLVAYHGPYLMTLGLWFAVVFGWVRNHELANVRPIEARAA